LEYVLRACSILYTAVSLALLSGCEKVDNPKSREPVVHSYPRLPPPNSPNSTSGITATEYFLPNPSLPPKVEATLHPWIKQVARADLKEVKRLLQERWGKIHSSEVAAIREQLLSWRPESVVVDAEGKAWLRLASNKDEDIIGSSAYIPPPVDEGELKEKLLKFEIKPDSVFAEFMLNFSGLGEDFLTSGNFINLSDEWITLDQQWEEYDIEGYGAWKDSLWVYHSRGSDTLLLRSDGAVGWFRHAERRITKAFDSLTEFLKFYVHFRTLEPNPLDSYSMDDAI
jgi:hypothetical protein